jgi:transposase
MTQTCTLDIKQTSLLVALLQGSSIEEAAKCAGVSRRTAYNLYGKPEFQAAYNEAKQEAFTRELAILKKDVHLAIKALKRGLDEKAPLQVQIRAASVWLDHTFQQHKIEEIEAKIEELTTLLKGAM